MDIGIIGLGLIGGSFAKAVKSRAEHRVFAFNRSRTPLDMALAEGNIDGILEEDFTELDLILIALYPGNALEFLRRHTFRRGAVIIDLCGVKRRICAEAERLCRDMGAVFIGGHPMAGREAFGYEYSIPGLFDGASMILTPPAGTDERAVRLACDFFTGLGFGHVELTTPERHDEMIAYTSQLAHVVSSAYVKSPSAFSHIGYSAGSFKDLTRVAKLNEHMWSELFLLNGDYLVREIDTLVDNLKQYRDAITDNDAPRLTELLRDGRVKKERLNELEP